jgi:hypothetical protein
MKPIKPFFTRSCPAAALLFVTFLSALNLSAAPTDAEANKQIDSAINTHYAGADIAKAEKTLLDLIAACQNQCAPTTLARAWMYVGIVRGSGKDDIAGAQKAFSAAKRLDPNVKLDDLFATELVKRVFQQTTAAATGEMPLIGEIQARAGEEPPVSNISCTPTVSEVETQRPIPFACKVPGQPSKVILSYKHERDTSWHDLPLTLKGKNWVGEIACSETKQLGVLAYRVRTLNAQGQEADKLGDEQDPLEINLVDQTDAAPPALPEQKAPESCRPKKPEPAPKGPLLGGYGQACTTESQCQGGLSCIDGKCAADVTCEKDSDCGSGICDDGKCSFEEQCEGENCASKVPKNWFGLQGGMDFALMSGERVCDMFDSNRDTSYSCFNGDAPYVGYPNHNLSGSINSGFQASTVRLMVSYERVLLPIFTLEGRVGFAFNGGPESPESDGGDGSSFLPVHAEVRAKLYFSKVFADDARNLTGLSAYFALGGGLGQIDPKVDVTVGECVETPPALQSDVACVESPNSVVRTRELTVYKRLGQSFISGGPGLRYGFTKNIAATLHVAGVFLIPSTGLSITPSLGVSAGF